MSSRWPRVLRRKRNRLSPWVEIIEREVQFAPDEASQTYHALALPDYVTALAVTEEGRFLLVHQYRPSIEDFTCELPSGLVEGGESPAETCLRELREETGYDALSVRELGINWVDGRLNNRLHAFFVVAGKRTIDFVPEPGVEVSMATADELAQMVTSGRLAMYIHAGVILQAVLRGYLNADLSLP